LPCPPECREGFFIFRQIVFPFRFFCAITFGGAEGDETTKGKTMLNEGARELAGGVAVNQPDFLFPCDVVIYQNGQRLSAKSIRGMMKRGELKSTRRGRFYVTTPKWVREYEENPREVKPARKPVAVATRNQKRGGGRKGKTLEERFNVPT